MKTTAILASLALALMATTGCDDDAAGGETQTDMGTTQDGSAGAGGAGNEGGGGAGGAGNEGGVGGVGGAGNEGGGVGGEGGAGNEGGVGGEGGAGNEGGGVGGEGGAGGAGNEGGEGGAGGAGNEGGEGGAGGAGGGEPAEGPVNSGRLDSLSIADAGAPQCRDLNGDGRPDNAFGGLAGLANGEIAGAIADDDLILLTTSIGIDAPGLMGAFDLALFTADRDGAGYLVDAEAIGPDGQPLILFRGAQVNGGVMRAGPGDFNLQVPVQGQNLDLSVTSTQIDATMGIDAAGLTLGSGTISGQITQANLDAALVVVPAEFRGLVPLLLQPDIDSDGNGSPDSYSICLNFTSAPVTMSGFPLE